MTAVEAFRLVFSLAPPLLPKGGVRNGEAATPSLLEGPPLLEEGGRGDGSTAPSLLEGGGGRERWGLPLLLWVSTKAGAALPSQPEGRQQYVVTAPSYLEGGEDAVSTRSLSAELGEGEGGEHEAEDGVTTVGTQLGLKATALFGARARSPERGDKV